MLSRLGFWGSLVAFVASCVLLGVFFGEVWHWILNVTGDNTSGTRWNLAWSGFLSAGVITTGIFTGVYHRMREKNCHNHGCWRIAHCTTANGHHLCKKCVGKPESQLVLHEIHPDHK